MNPLHAVRHAPAVALLRASPQFRLLFVGQSVSLLGDPLLPFALAFASLEQGGVATFGWLLAARSAGALLLTLAGGIVADERRQTRVMAACDAVRLLLVVAIGATLAFQEMVVTALLVFAMGGIGAFFRPALSAAVPRLVDDDRHLEAANGLLMVTSRTAALVGPALGALLVSVTNITVVLAVNGATFAVSALCFVAIRAGRFPTRPTTPLMTRINEGISAVRRRRWLVIMLVLGVVQLALCLAPWLTLLPSVLDERGYEPWMYGACLAMTSAGNIVGAFAAGWVRPTRPGVVAQLALLPFGLLLLVLATGAPTPAILAAHFLAGVGIDLYLVLWTAAVQRDVPAHVRGRVFALDSLGSTALMPLAFAFLGTFGGRLDSDMLLVVGGVVGVAISLVPLVDPQIRAYATIRRHPVVPARDEASAPVT